MTANNLTLQLTPNEVVGYRIKPDWNSYNVVLVKKHGPTSKSAGETYETPLAYCKNLAYAAEWIFSHATKVKAAEAQKEAELLGQAVDDAKAFAAAFDVAKAEVMQAVTELQARMEAAGLFNKDVVKALQADSGALET